MTDKVSGVDHLDEKLLADYLGDKIEGIDGSLSASKFAGGQSNPTFKLQCNDKQWVLRRQPPGSY